MKDKPRASEEQRQKKTKKQVRLGDKHRESEQQTTKGNIYKPNIETIYIYPGSLDPKSDRVIYLPTPFSSFLFLPPSIF